MHIVVINPKNGKVVTAQVYDTYRKYENRSSTEMSKFDNFVSENIPDNYIVAAACKDDCAENLSENIK